MANYVTQEMVQKARDWDLYSYMESFEPDNLTRVCAGTYRLKEHDSVVISNGYWHQKSTGVGGKTALDYLIKVRGMGFVDAVTMLAGGGAQMPRRQYVQQPKPKAEFKLPPKNFSSQGVQAYLRSRGICQEVLDYCLSAGSLYESSIHHNAVFVGFDYSAAPAPKYANLRGIRASAFKGEVAGSDKRFSFHMGNPESSELHIFEAAIDAMSYASLEQLRGVDWRQESLLSLGGVAARKDGGLPPALGEYLQHHKVGHVYIHLDMDAAGRENVAVISKKLGELGIPCTDIQVSAGKDVNDFLLAVRKEFGLLEKPTPNRRTQRIAEPTLDQSGPKFPPASQPPPRASAAAQIEDFEL